MRQGASTAEKDIGHIQLKLPKDLYRSFRRICVDKDTNMRAKAVELIEEFIKKEGEGPSFLEMTKGQREALASKATRAAIARSHAMGHPTTHADEKGIYELYPDGRKEYIELYPTPGQKLG